MVYGQLREMTASVFTTISELRDYLQLHYRSRQLRIGFVPTMGALHEGHLSLVRRSNSENDITVVSVFVNPTQFGPNEDFSKYPRPIEEDFQKLKPLNCVIFMPNTDEMINGLSEFNFSPSRLSQILEGATRPGHFDGVCKIVMKLFQIVAPHRSYFGEKDFQQLVVINQMVETFSVPTLVIPCPIVRESDGLAMSSRNRYLTNIERNTAAHISEVLHAVKDYFGRDQSLTGEMICEFGRREFSKYPSINLDYFVLADTKELNEIKGPVHDQARLLVAGIVGKTRLLDNVEIAAN